MKKTKRKIYALDVLMVLFAVLIGLSTFGIETTSAAPSKIHNSTTQSKKLRSKRPPGATPTQTPTPTNTPIGGSPLLAWAPLAHDFGNVVLGFGTGPQTFTLTNSGSVPATGCSAPVLGGTDPGSFVIVTDTCATANLPSSGGTCAVTLQAATLSSLGLKRATLSRTCSNGSASTTANGIQVTGVAGPTPTETPTPTATPTATPTPTCNPYTDVATIANPITCVYVCAPILAPCTPADQTLVITSLTCSGQGQISSCNPMFDLSQNCAVGTCTGGGTPITPTPTATPTTGPSATPTPTPTPVSCPNWSGSWIIPTVTVAGVYCASDGCGAPITYLLTDPSPVCDGFCGATGCLENGPGFCNYTCPNYGTPAWTSLIPAYQNNCCNPGSTPTPTPTATPLATPTPTPTPAGFNCDSLNGQPFNSQYLVGDESTLNAPGGPLTFNGLYYQDGYSGCYCHFNGGGEQFYCTDQATGECGFANWPMGGMSASPPRITSGGQPPSGSIVYQGILDGCGVPNTRCNYQVGTYSDCGPHPPTCCPATGAWTTNCSATCTGPGNFFCAPGDLQCY